MLNQDYKDILLSFLEENVEFVLVGAYALAKHGLIRATGDIDLFVNSTPKNSRKVFLALKRFGAPVDQIDENTFTEKEIVFQIGVNPKRIDILTHIDGVTFKDCWKNHENIQWENLTVPIISLEDLYKNKISTGRTQDKADAEWIESLSKK